MVLATASTASAQRGSEKAVFQFTSPAVVMILAVDVEAGRLVPVASGSGSLITRDGSILTNYHVIHDESRDRPHDLFVVGRFMSDQRQPDLYCAGIPAHAREIAALDLALIKCELNLRGQPYPSHAEPFIEIGRSEDLTPGERLWILGYPNAGGSPIRVTSGLLTGWIGEHDGAGSRAFIKTDATLSPGDSGGAAMDPAGRLIGIPTAFRRVTEVSENRITNVGKIGLLRPIEHARELIRLARPERPTFNVLVRSRLVDNFNEAPVAGAFVVVIKPGRSVAEVDEGKLSDAVLTWGQTNERGIFTLETALPVGKYGLVIWAKGYYPLAQDNALIITEKTPILFDPFSTLRLMRKRS
jgi:S1-C subfamily serine protease